MPGIYIHIPFCKQACFYCDFHFSTSLKHKQSLIKAILKEIKLRADDWKNNTFETIYFGGGTPSILETKEIKKILYTIKQYYKTSKNAEVTLEGNPDDLNYKKLLELKEIGINRLSIGIQSFFNDDLIKLNRSHNGKEAEIVLKNAFKAGFQNISIDLIYGIPGLTNKKWEKNIQKVLDMKIPHISAYALTIEEKTTLSWKIKKGLFPKVSESQSADQFEILREKLQTEKFIHYEVSNFGKEDYFSKHNINYWKNIPYLGLGPASHSYKEKRRRWNIANNMKYIKGIEKNNYYTEEILNPYNIYNELVMIGLRTIWGVNLEKIEKLGSNYLTYLKKQSKKYIEEKQLFIENKHLKINPKHLFTVEKIIVDLFIV